MGSTHNGPVMRERVPCDDVSCVDRRLGHFYKSYNAPVPYPTMNHSEQKWAYFCPEWCIVGYVIGAWWDLCNMSVISPVCNVHMEDYCRRVSNNHRTAPRWTKTTPPPQRHGDLQNYMMTSSYGNIFRVTGPFCGKFVAHRWIPLTKVSDAELWCFL